MVRNKAITRKKPIDPLTLSIIEGRLEAMNSELGERVLRQSFSYSTAHMRDIGSALIDTQGRMINIGNYMPAHSAGADIGLKGILDAIGRENIHKDDFLLGNDPFVVRLGHLPDWSFVRPIFYGDDLVFYHFFKTHQYDTGGAQMGGYYPGLFDCHAEGLLIPPLKLIDRGVLDEKIYGLILRNVRGAAMMRADHMLVYASMKKAEERIIGLFDAYGKETVLTACDELIRRTEASVRREIATWPAGTYRAERAVDWDGTTDRPVWARLSLTINPKEGQLIFDLTESDDQVDYINLSYGRAAVALLAAVAWTLPSDMPRNQGMADCITLVTRENSIFSPRYPATTQGQVILAAVLTECALAALGQAVPEKTSAMWAKHLCPKFTGRRREKIDPRTGSFQLYSVATFHSDGGNGAIYGYDGTDGLGPYNDAGGILKAPIEVEEWEMPYRWLKLEFMTDSCGHGRWRGGLGPHVEMLNTSDPTLWQPHDSVAMTGNSDGEFFPPLGLIGGTPGRVHQMGIRRKGRNIKLRTLSSAYLAPGDIIWTKSGGGGGVGDPLDREAEEVRWDVLNGYVSNRAARQIYGVVIHPRTCRLDEQATRRLRAKMSAGRGRGK